MKCVIIGIGLLLAFLFAPVVYCCMIAGAEEDRQMERDFLQREKENRK